MAERKNKNPKKIKLMRADNYRGCMIYIRRIGKEIFEYLVVFNEQVFNAYIVMKPEKGRSKLTKPQVNHTVGMIYAGAVTTVDELMSDPDKYKEMNIKPKELKLDKGEVEGVH